MSHTISSILMLRFRLGSSATFSHDARARYISHFGPLNSQFSIANHTLVLLDAPTLVEEDYRRNGRGQSFDDWKAAPDGPIQFAKSFAAGTLSAYPDRPK